MQDVPRQPAIFAKRPGLWLALFAGLLCTQIGPWFYAERDSCAYLSAARSLAHDGTLESLGRPGSGGITTYPLLIWPAYLFGDRPFVAVGVLQVLLAIVAMYGAYLWAGRVLPEMQVMLTGLSFVNAMFLLHLRRPLKEVAVLAFLIWTVNVLHLAYTASDRRRAGVWGFVGSILLAATVSLRFATCVFAVAFVGLAGWTAWRERERRRPLVTALGTFLGPGLLLAAGLWVRGGSVVDAVRMKIAASLGFAARQETGTLLDGMRRELGEIVRITVPGMFKAYSNEGHWLHPFGLATLATALMLVVGWWYLVRVRRVRDVFLLGLPLYMAAYMAWPYDQGARFMVVMLPAACACVWMGFVVPLRLPVPTIALSFCCHAGVALGYWYYVDLPRAIEQDAQWSQVETLADGLPEHPDGVTAVDVDWQLVCMLQLEFDRSVQLTRTPEAVSDESRWLIVPADGPAPARFRLVTETADYRLLERDETPPATIAVDDVPTSLR